MRAHDGAERCLTNGNQFSLNGIEMAMNGGFGSVFAPGIQFDDLHIRRKETTSVSDVDGSFLLVSRQHPDNNASLTQRADCFRYCN